MRPHFQTGAFLDYLLDDDNSHLSCNPLTYFTMLSRGADMRRTGGPRPSHAIFYRRMVTNARCASGELHQRLLKPPFILSFSAQWPEIYPSPAIVSPEKGAKRPV